MPVRFVCVMDLDDSILQMNNKERIDNSERSEIKMKRNAAIHILENNSCIV